MDDRLIRFIGTNGPRYKVPSLPAIPLARFTVHKHRPDGIETYRYTGSISRFNEFQWDGKPPSYTFMDTRLN